MENYFIDAGILFFQNFSTIGVAIVLIVLFLTSILYIGEKQGADQEYLNHLREIRGYWKFMTVVGIAVAIILTLASSSLQFNRTVDVEQERSEQHQEYKEEIEEKKQLPIVDKTLKPKRDDDEREEHFDHMINSWKDE